MPLKMALMDRQTEKKKRKKRKKKRKKRKKKENNNNACLKYFWLEPLLNFFYTADKSVCHQQRKR